MDFNSMITVKSMITAEWWETGAVVFALGRHARTEGVSRVRSPAWSR